MYNLIVLVILCITGASLVQQPAILSEPPLTHEKVLWAFKGSVAN